MRLAECHRGRRGAARSSLIVGLGVWLWSVGLWADQSCDTSLYPLSTPSSRFEDHGDGTVTDRLSNLMWMRCSAGQVWTAGHCTGEALGLTWSAAQSAATAINQSGHFFFKDWRVPQLPELASIAERQCKDPRINLSVFPETPVAAYWTATSRAADTNPTQAFILSFGADGVSYAAKTETHDLRLVRTGP
jgi:hypothetical protein